MMMKRTTVLALMLSTVATICLAQEAQAQQVAPKNILTPQAAIADILAEPLQFIGRFSGEHIGLFDDICLFHNSKVAVRVDYCKPAGKGERRGNEVAGLTVFRPDGQQVRLYAEVKNPGVITAAKRPNYVMFNVEYSDARDVSPSLKPKTSETAFTAFVKAKKDLKWGKYGVCFVSRPRPGDSKTKVTCQATSEEVSKKMTKDLGSFYKNPPASWYKLLKVVSKLVDKHGG